MEDLLRDVGGDGVHEADGCDQDRQQQLLLVLLQGLIPHFAEEHGLRHFDVIRTELVPEERVAVLCRAVVQVPLEAHVDVPDDRVQAGQNPPVLQREQGLVQALHQICGAERQVHDHKPRAVPHFVREVLVVLKPAPVQVDLAVLRGAGGQGHAHRVGAVRVDDLDGVQDVALRLGHLLPLGLHPRNVLPGVQLLLLLRGHVLNAAPLLRAPVRLAVDQALQ
mmetsp:Transcript_64276/g.106321  ORF Transcript_64276/g.106321 Transcript_64276/m.106321 type:complete len:222 (-) Transcript_64276:1796-2461(-)